MKGAILISSWCQPTSTLNETHIRRQVELIAQLTIDEIQANYPRNAILTLNKGQCLCDSEAAKLRESRWESKHSREILFCLNSVFFGQLKFYGNRDHYYDASNSYIDIVIQNRFGIPITMCILYQAIAAKLGVATLPVNFPGHFLLKWKEFPR